MEEFRAYFENACFVAGTPVRMANGEFKAIDQIQTGDMVSSRDQFGGGGVVSARVLRTFVRQSDHIRILKLRAQLPQQRSRSPQKRSSSSQSRNSGSEDGAGGSDDDASTVKVLIRTTDEHPFWVVGKGWTPAKSIGLGDIVASANNPQGCVCEQNSRENHPEGVAVYNLEVEDTHTYFVSEQAIWVHNLCKGEVIFQRLRAALGLNADARTADFRRAYLEYIGYGKSIVANRRAIFRGQTYQNFRRNTIRFFEQMGLKVPRAAWEAHHSLPACLEDLFLHFGINPHDPIFSIPLPLNIHHGFLHDEYINEWRELLEKVAGMKGLTHSQAEAIIMSEGRKIVRKNKYNLVSQLPSWSPFK